MSTYSPLISQKVKFHGNLPLSQQNRGQLGYSQVIADFSHTPTSVQQMKVVENSQISSKLKLVKPPPIRFDMLELLLREKEATSFEEIKVQVKNSLPKFRRKKISSKPNSIQTSIRSVDGVMVENKKRKQKSSKIPFTTEISKLLSQQTGTSKSTIEQNEESKKGKPASAIFEENKQFIRDVQLEIDLIFANQVINEMNDDTQGLDEEEIAQKNETINALREMNDLWATRLDELNQQAYDIEEEKVINLMKQGTKEDKALFKKLCDEKPELKQAQLQYLKLQQIISAQKVEKGLVKSRIDSYKNDPDKVDLINRVKELEKINAELEYREKKLYKFNQNQFKAVHREAIEPSAVQRQEIVELEEMITNYKSKHKLLLGFKAKQDKMANIRFNNIQKQKTLNNELQAEVFRLAKQGFQVAQIQFQTNRSRERQLALSPAPLPIQLEVERNRKKEPKKYDSSAVIQLNEKERDRLQLSVKRQEAQILAFQNEIAETKQALKMHEYYLTDVTLRYQSIQNEAMKNQILVKSQRHKSVKTSLRPSQSQNISLQQIQEETPPLQLQDSSKIIARIKRQRNAQNLKLSKSQNNRLKKKQEKSPPSNKQTTFLTMPDQESSEEDFYKLPSERGNDFYSENLIKIEQNDNFYSLAHDRSLSKISLKKPTLTGKNNQNYIQKPGYNSEQPLQALNSAYTPNLPPSKNTISTDIDLRNIRINPLRQSVSVVGKGPGLISELPPIAPKGRNNMIEGPKLRVSMSRDVYNPYESRSKK